MWKLCKKVGVVTMGVGFVSGVIAANCLRACNDDLCADTFESITLTATLVALAGEMTALTGYVNDCYSISFWD